MTNAWITLAIAGLLEVAWAIGLKYGEGFFNFRNKPVVCTLTWIGLIASMYLLSVAMRSLPVGTAYAVWTGIGALGAATLGIVIFHEPASVSRIACLLMIVAGIVGLKLTSPIAKGDAMERSSIDVYVGGYEKGLTRVTFDPADGTLRDPTPVAELQAASFLAVHPTLPMVYAVSEIEKGVVVAFKREASGALLEVNRASTGGNGPCHVTVDPAGRAVFAANYGDGTVAMILLEADGSLSGRSAFDQHEGSGPNEKRQAHAYAHSFYPHPNGTHALSADLGCDAIFIYAIDFERGAFTEKKSVAIHPGSGPRHLAFSRDGRWVFAVNELNNTVTVLQWTDVDASLSAVQSISTLPAGFEGTSSCAEIRMHPSGEFLYASNRGHDSIAVFRIDADRGTLTAVGHVPTGGKSPRGFELDPAGRFLIAANQKSDHLAVFKIDEATGLPMPTGTVLPIEKPSCVRFAAGGD